MGDYFEHWPAMRKLIEKPPRIFHVNWFHKDADRNFLWPGFGKNVCVLKWIVDRYHGRADADETPLGWAPGPQCFDLRRSNGFSREKLRRMQSINCAKRRREIPMQD